MQKQCVAIVGGRLRALHYSVATMFAVIDEYGGVEQALEALDRPGMAGFDAVRWFAVALANDAELCRRADGYDPQPMLAPGDVTPQMQPWAYEALRRAIVAAIAQGYNREVEDEEAETDLGLAELNAKKDQAGG